MSVGGAIAAGTAGGVKKGFKWWAIKVGLALAFSAGAGILVGALIAAHAPIILGVLAGAAIAGIFGTTIFSFGGLIAGAGFLFGGAKATSKYLQNEQATMQQQTTQLAAENEMRRQNIQEMGMMNPGAPEDGRFAAMEAARRQAQPNPNVPPLRG